MTLRWFRFGLSALLGLVIAGAACAQPASVDEMTAIIARVSASQAMMSERLASALLAQDARLAAGVAADEADPQVRERHERHVRDTRANGQQPLSFRTWAAFERLQRERPAGEPRRSPAEPRVIESNPYIVADPQRPANRYLYDPATATFVPVP